MPAQPMSLETDAVANNGVFDPRYTCDSDNSSPELRWEYVPEDAAGFVLIAEDLDSSQDPFTHWVIYNIPRHIHHLPAGIPSQESLPNGILQGTNSFGKLGYSGPCPPQGDPYHHYVFRLYALKSVPKYGRRMTRGELLDLIQIHVLTVAETVGKYQRVIQRAG